MFPFTMRWERSLITSCYLFYMDSLSEQLRVMKEADGLIIQNLDDAMMIQEMNVVGFIFWDYQL